MQNIKQKIISILKEKGTELCTLEIIYSISNEYENLRKQGKYAEARKFHRNVLYHINMLRKERIIRFTKYGGKNAQKYFIINVSEGEEIMQISPTKYKKQLIGNGLSFPAMPIEGYEQQGIILKYDPKTWSERLNSVVVMCENIKSQRGLFSIVGDLYAIVNDTICLENFEAIINKSDASKVIARLDKEAKYYNKKISCIVHISKLNIDMFLKRLDKISDPKLENVEFIYSIGKRDNKVFVEQILSKYAKNKKSIYIRNEDKCKSPWFVGRAGIYSFDDKAWEKLKKPTCIGCSQSSVIVDVQKFYEEYGMNVSQFSELLMNISKSFLAVNSIHRKKIRSYFDKHIHSNQLHEHDFMELSRNYIRFWNYGLLQNDVDQDKVLNVMEKARNKVDEFCNSEDRIYNSCGMAIRFKISLSAAFKKSDLSLSSAKYKKIKINDLNDLRKEKTAKEIFNIKKVSRLFDGGNRIDFARDTFSLSGKDLANEIFYILNEYRLRFFSYDFNGN